MKVIAIVFASLLIAFTAFAQQAPAKKEASQPAQMRRPCAEDAAKFCKDVQPGGGRVIACLQGQRDKLSPACKTEMSKMQERRQERKQERQQERQQKKGASSAAPTTPATPDATKK